MVAKSPEMQKVREEEVKALREALIRLKEEETFHLKIEIGGKPEKIAEILRAVAQIMETKGKKIN